MSTEITSTSSRARLRAGRRVTYQPTAAEETDFGVGPYAGQITFVHPDGSCDLLLHFPGTGSVASDAVIASALPAAIAAATPTALTATAPTAVVAADPSGALGAFTDPPTAGEMAALRTLVNELRTLVVDLKARQAENRTLAVDVIARQAERRTLEVDVKARLAEYRTLVNEIKTDWGGEGAVLKQSVLPGGGRGQFVLFGAAV